MHRSEAADASAVGAGGCDGEFINPAPGSCLDDGPGSSTTNGTQLDLWICNGGSSQQWSLG